MAAALTLATSNGYAAPAPQWAAKLALGTWGRVVGENTAADVDPALDDDANPQFPRTPVFSGNTGYLALFEAWSSAGYTPNEGPCGSILYIGGGRDYMGNQVVALNICGGTGGSPIWQRLTDPYPGPFAPPFAKGEYANHTPAVPYTYDLVAVDPSRNALVLMQTTAGAPTYASLPNAWVFDIKARHWRGPYAHRGAAYGTSAYDSRRKLVWFQPQQGMPGELTSFNPDTGAMAYYGWPYAWAVGSLDSVMGHDAVRDRLVMTTFRGNTTLIAERPPGLSSAPWKVAVQERAPAKSWGQHTLAWSSRRNAWIVWMDLGSGATVYEVRYRTTNTAGAPVYTWTPLTGSANTVVPIAPTVAHGGSFERFQLVRFDDGSEVLVGQLRAQDPIYAFKVSAPNVSSTTTTTSSTTTSSSATLPPLIPPEPTSPAASLSTQATAIAPGTWAAIATDNTARAIDPARDPAANPNYPKLPPYSGATGYSALWQAWNSGVFVPTVGPCGAIVNFGGGHMDYWGNEVVALNLCGGTAGGPIWQRLSEPYTGPITWPFAGGEFPNHTPVPSHTYDTLSFDPSTNSLVVLQTMSSGLASKYEPNAWRFSFTTRTWSGPFPHRGAQYGVSAFDSRRGLVWFQPQQGLPGELTAYNPATGAFTYYGWPYASGVGGLDSVMGYDAARDKLVLTSFRANNKVMAEHSLDTPNTAWRVVEQRNVPDTVYGQQVFAWSKLRDAWIVWMPQGGNMVYEVRATGVNASGTPVYTWMRLTAADNAVTPIEPAKVGTGPFEKFQIMQTATGDEVLIGQMSPADGVFAFKIPARGAEPVQPSATASEACAATGTCIPAKFREPGWDKVCGQPGIFVCDNFGDASTLDGTIYAGESTPHLDNGELVFDIASNSGANAGGNYTLTFPAVGESGFLALSYRVKANGAALGPALAGRKEFILWRGAASCTDLELAQNHYYTLPVISAYTECGGNGFMVPLGNGDYQVQYPDYDCKYSKLKSDLSGCSVSHPDVWENYYIEVQIGTYGMPNSRVVMWHKSDGGVWKRYIERNDFTFRGYGGFDHFMLTVYMTRKDPTIAHPPGQVRFDHLIMATKPFAVDSLLGTP